MSQSERAKEALPSSSTDESDSIWVLAGQYEKIPEAGVQHVIKYVRPIKDPEYNTIKSATHEFGLFGQDWEWNKIQGGLEDFLADVTEISEQFLKAKTLNRDGIPRASRSFDNAIARIQNWLSRLKDGEGGQQGIELRTVLEWVLRQQVIVAVLQMTPSESEPSISLHETDNVPPRLLPFVRIGQGDSSATQKVVRADTLLVRTVDCLQAVASQVLLDHKESLTEAASLFAQLEAETVGGRPTVMPRESLSNAGKTGSTQLSMNILPSHHIVPIIRAIRIAEKAMNDFAAMLTSEASPPGQHGQNQSQDRTGGHTSSSNPKRPSGVPSPAESESESQTTSVEMEAGPGSDGENEDNSKTSTLVSLEAAIRQASQLSQSIEQKWSAALVTAERWSEDNFSQWVSVISLLQQQTIERSRLLEESGLHNRLPQIPLPENVLETFQISAEGQQKVTQLHLAEIDSLQDLLTGMAGLKEPTATTVELPSGRSRSWWEAGAFASVVDLASVALRVNREMEVLTSGGQLSEFSHGLLDDLSALNLCLHRGLPEAALVYLNRTLSGLEESGMVTAVGDLEILQGHNRRAVAEAAQMLCQGKYVALGFLVPTVHYWARKVNDIVGSHLQNIGRAG